MPPLPLPLPLPTPEVSLLRPGLFRPSSALRKRQSSAVIPADYTNINDSLSPGAIIGIVIGSVAGFLLLLWLLYIAMGGDMSAGTVSVDVDNVVIRKRKRSSRRGSSKRTSRVSRVSETVEIRRPSAPPPPPQVDRIIVEERREERRESRAPPTSSIGSDEVVVIEEHSPPRRRQSGARARDEVVVIEEHSPPPRRASSVRVRETVRERESGFRVVDPLAYGGGDGPLRDGDSLRDVSRRGSSRSRR